MTTTIAPHPQLIRSLGFVRSLLLPPYTAPRTPRRLRLYIWPQFSGDGLAFAIADSEAQARGLVDAKLFGLSPANWGPLEVRDLDKRVARATLPS